MPLTEGQRFAGYTIIRLLGAGGMGEVYLAQHPRLPRRDALKLLPVDVSADEEYRARFAREADLASTLFHPHIVGVHDRGEAEGQLWISMDLIDGLDAAQLLTQRHSGGMPPNEVADVVTAVASALDYAHKQGLLHRDVKPANIMLTHVDDNDERRIMLADFGIARDMHDISGVTATNMTVGTVAYSAPEQLMGESLDGRADQYALAATAYHLLTGQTLFPNTNPAVVISRHLNADPPRPSTIKPELAPVDSVFAAALAKDPADRFARCSDFAQALREQLTHGTGTGTAPTTPAPLSKRRRDAATPPSPAGNTHRQPTGERHTAPAATSRPPEDRGKSATNKTPFIVVAALATLALAAIAGLFWRPWQSDRDAHSASPITSTVQSPLTSTPAAETPPAPVPSTFSSAPLPSTTITTTTVPPDPYSYALPACYYDGPPTEKPESIGFQTCADGSRRLESMSWSSWDSAGAQGTGVFSFKVCEPNCADGYRASYNVNVTAYNPRPAGYNSGCPTNTLFYSEMVLSFPTSAPDFANATYLGRPAIQFTTGTESASGSLGNQLCY